MPSKCHRSLNLMKTHFNTIILRPYNVGRTAMQCYDAFLTSTVYKVVSMS